MESLNEHGTFAGAIRGPHGYWAPKRSFWVYDDAFLTAGANFVDVAPASKNGKSCATSYDAIRDFLTDFDPNRYMFAAATEVTRQDNNGNAIGTWAVGDGKVGCPKLCNMRHFAAIKAGRFRLQFSDPSGGQRVPKRFEATLGNLLSKDDQALFAIAFTSSQAPTSITFDGDALVTVATHGPSVQAVQADPSGTTYFQDKANNVIWVKAIGGRNSKRYESDLPNSDGALYQAARLIIQ